MYNLSVRYRTSVRNWLRQELCVNGKAHSVDQVKTLILMYHVFL